MQPYTFLLLLICSKLPPTPLRLSSLLSFVQEYCTPDDHFIKPAGVILSYVLNFSYLWCIFWTHKGLGFQDLFWCACPVIHAAARKNSLSIL